MALKAGEKLGSFEILGAIGAGGQGEVYKARDTRLDRHVAIKVLPAHLSTRLDLRERFEREARTVSSLNHPHICTLYDIGKQDGTDFLVMEYLEGETLAARLTRGPLHLGEALKVAIEISDALDKAHRQGITHRDLKPGNIMLTKSGSKLLDFGLAKLTSSLKPDVRMSNMPTGGAADLTAEGTILGTLQYMSPEQLEGGEADARSDIFAFGAVLYEMLTGRKAFEGRSQSSLIGAILHVDPPDISQLQPAIPALLDRIVKTCLAKDPNGRWQTAHDIGLQLQWVGDGGVPSGGSKGAEVPLRRSRERLAWALFAAAAIAMFSLALPAARSLFPPMDTHVVRFEIQPPPMGIPSTRAISISPDGQTLAFTANDPNGKLMLYIRGIDSAAAQALPGTEGARSPMWSPNSRYIAFSNGLSELKKIDVGGGLPQTICEKPGGQLASGPGSWSADDVILFTGSDGLYRVPAAGGTPARITTVDKAREEIRHLWPYFLPDGRHFLYTVLSNRAENQGIYVGSLDAKGSTRLLQAESKPVYAPPGFLLFQREGTLFAQAFDAERIALRGEAVPLADGLAYGYGIMFDASANGRLVYLTADRGQPLTWVGRDGKPLGVAVEAGQYRAPAISPDGKQLAYGKTEGSHADIWITDLARAVTARFTFDNKVVIDPIWSPDSARIAFSSQREGQDHNDLYIKEVGATDSGKRVLSSDDNKVASGWSADGRYLLYFAVNPKTKYDLWVLPLNGDRKPFLFAGTPFNEQMGMFSPDGNWIAYVSDESGTREVYVQSFPPTGSKFKVSTDYGVSPKWRADGKELFFLGDLGKDVMAVDVAHAAPGKPFEVSVPHLLFQATLAGFVDDYDVSKDGQRFIINGTPGTTPSPAAPISVILNWPALLNKK